jgi:molecular chaperone GrpE
MMLNSPGLRHESECGSQTPISQRMMCGGAQLSANQLYLYPPIRPHHAVARVMWASIRQRRPLISRNWSKIKLVTTVTSLSAVVLLYARSASTYRVAMIDADAGGNGQETQAEEISASAGDGGASGLLGELTGRLDEVERHLGEFHRRAAHRETVIDRLHEENQRLHEGFGRLILEPLTVDLIRLHDQLDREARRLDADGQEGQLLRSFADDVAQILDRCGMEIFSAESGDAFERGRHRAVGATPTQDESRHNTVAQVVAAGFYERYTGRVRRPVLARFHQYSPPAETTGQSDAPPSQ